MYCSAPASSLACGPAGPSSSRSSSCSGSSAPWSSPAAWACSPPSERHVPQTIARWRASGFDAHVAPLSPYEEHDPAAVRRAADALRAGTRAWWSWTCIGFRRKTRDEIAALTGAPTLVANLLVARVAAELLGR